MFTKSIVAAGMITLTLQVEARRGENDNRPGEDGRMIECVQILSGNNTQKILEFQSLQGPGQVTTAEYDLTVKTFGDEIREITVTDKRSNDIGKVKVLEENVIATLTSAGFQTPARTESLTQRGAARFVVTHPESKDVLKVDSLNRRGQSVLSVSLQTVENSDKVLSFQCKKM